MQNLVQNLFILQKKNFMRTAIVFAIIGLLAMSAFAETCNGNCPAGACPSCPCGRQPAKQDAVQWCAKFNGWDQRCCQCIIQQESSGNSNAMDYNTDSTF